MKAIAITLALFVALRSSAQTSIVGRWKFDCIFIDRDTIFLRSDSLIGFKTAEKKRLRDTLSRRLYFKGTQDKVDSAMIRTAYRLQKTASITFYSGHKSKWYMPVRPGKKEEAEEIEYSLSGDTLMLYDKSNRETPDKFQYENSDGILTLKSLSGVPTIFTLSRK